MTSIDRAPARRLTPLQWLICAIAALGFAFDSYELLMLPLIVRPALAELLGVAPNSLMVNDWVATCSTCPRRRRHLRSARWISHGSVRPAACAGVEHPALWLLALAAGFSTSVGWLLFWRCCTFVGVCVEFVARRRVARRALPEQRAARARDRLTRRPLDRSAA
jgi:hypothetical protein